MAASDSPSTGMAASDKPSSGIATPQLSTRELDIAIHGIACLRDNGIDASIMAQLTGYKSDASARARWSELRQKLTAHYAQSGVPGVPITLSQAKAGPATAATTTTTTPRTPGKKTPAGKKRTRKVAFSGSDGEANGEGVEGKRKGGGGSDGDDSPSKKRAIRRTLTPKRRKTFKSAAAVSDEEEEEKEAAAAVAVPATPEKAAKVEDAAQDVTEAEAEAGEAEKASG